MIFAFRHDSGKLSYVSIIPTYEFAEVTDQSLVNIHLNYELLPPHPSFITPVYLKLQNIVLLNTGDMLFAILLKDVFDKNETKVTNQKHISIATALYRKSFTDFLGTLWLFQAFVFFQARNPNPNVFPVVRMNAYHTIHLVVFVFVCVCGQGLFVKNSL